MKITKVVTHRINMGPYESLTIGATVELEVPEGTETDAALDEIDLTIASAIKDDLREARRIAHDESYIHSWGA